MTYKKDVETLRVLLGGSKALQHSSELSSLYGELRRLELAGRRSADKGWLLAVLHTTRTLDTALSEVLSAKGWKGAKSNSLGRYLSDFRDNGVLHPALRDQYRTTVVNPRNKYMHNAGAIPQKTEADYILSEMIACLQTILGAI